MAFKLIIPPTTKASSSHSRQTEITRLIDACLNTLLVKILKILLLFNGTFH